MQVVNFQLLPQVRKEVHDRIAYLIAPVIAVRAGVLNGQLLPAEEISKSVAAWDWIPLPIGHPRENGQFISVNRQDILDKCIGVFRNPHFDGFSLRGELWLDIAKATNLGGDALATLERIEKGEQLEVSTAYNVTQEDTSTGVFYGQTYEGVQRGLQPDHLALLPYELGACSWADGCGAPRVNEDMMTEDMPPKKKKRKERMKSMWNTLKEKLFSNIEQSFSATEQAINALDDDSPQAEPPPNANGYPPNAAPPSSQHKTNCDCPPQHVNQEVSMTKAELVTAVLKAQGLPESEREKLEALPEAILQQLLASPEAPPKDPPPVPPNAPPPPDEPPVEAPPPPDAPSAPPPRAATVGVGLSADAQYMQNKQNDQARQHRAQLTAHIVANSALKAEQCAGMDLGTLETLAATLVPQVNYGGRMMPNFQTNKY